MRLCIIFLLVMMLACQTQKDTGKTENTSNKVVEVVQSSETVSSKSGSDSELENEQCYTDICLYLRNHNVSDKSFDIYMINTVPIAGFQCDLPGIDITGSDGGLLKENGYQTSNSDFRILSFSMQAKLIPVGMGILTEIYYNNPSNEVCMTEIIFAGIGGAKLSNNAPECMMLN